MPPIVGNAAGATSRAERFSMSAPPRPVEAGAPPERGKPPGAPSARRLQLQPVLLPVVSLVVFLAL
jgi:hypothetical protein